MLIKEQTNQAALAVREVVSNACIATVLGGISGSIGKYSLSFFNSGIINSVGGFGAFAGVGALTFALRLIPSILCERYIWEHSFFNDRPNLKSFLSRSLDFIFCAAATAASAAILGSAVLPTMACMLLIPAIITIIGTVYDVVMACRNKKLQSDDGPAPAAPAAPAPAPAPAVLLKDIGAAADYAETNGVVDSSARVYRG